MQTKHELIDEGKAKSSGTRLPCEVFFWDKKLTPCQVVCVYIYIYIYILSMFLILWCKIFLKNVEIFSRFFFSLLKSHEH